MKIKEIKQNLIDELNDNKEEIKKTKNPNDYIEEIVSNNLPIRNSDYLELAKENMDLATYVPEIFGFNGEQTAINSIAGNVYEELRDMASCWCEKNDIKL